MNFKIWLQLMEAGEQPTKEYTRDKRKRLALANKCKGSGEIQPREPGNEWAPVSRTTTFSIGGLG